MILSGMSLDSVGKALNAEGVVGPRGGDLQHSAIKNFLTNRALIGRIEYLGDGNANRARQEVDANWEAIVDPAIFQHVSQTLAKRTAAGGGRTRRLREQYPLTAVCAHCGIEYNGGRTKASQGNRRQYAHGNPKERLFNELHQRRVAAGCKIWYVDAVALEDGIKDLIIAQRGSGEFKQAVGVDHYKAGGRGPGSV